MMLTVKNELINLLEDFCPNNVYLQGTLNPNVAYPNTFITFFINDSEFDAFYDNSANKVDFYGSVMIYSNDADTIANMLPYIIVGMKAFGFIPQGMGNDIPSDVDTHTGWAIDFIYRNNF